MPEQAAVDLVAAAEPGAPLVHDDTDSNVACRTADNTGDIESAFAAADFVLREELRPERGAAQPMETRGVVARYDASLEQFTIWDTTQAPISARGVIADKLGMPEAAVTVIAPDVGGGFGVKIYLVYPEEVLVPFAARMLGRPVKWIEDRREHFIGSNHERLMVHRIEVAATKDGHILGIKDHFLYDSGAYCPYGPINAQCAQAILPGPYKIPAVHSTYEAVYTNTPTVSPYRGAGQPHGNFVTEAAMNHVARALRLDAAEIRRRNLVRPEDCPWDSGRIFQGNTPFIHRDSDYPAQLAKALDALDYEGMKRGQPAEREQGIFRGVGIAFFVEGTGISPYEGVEVRVEPTGHVHVTTGYPSQGQGHHTTLSQIVAETLAVPPEQVVVESGRSDRFAWGVGTFASRAAVVGGSAALGAAKAVRAKALDLASDELEVAPEDLVLADGAVHVKGAPQMAVTLGALAYAANPINTLASGAEPGLRAADYYRSPDGAIASGVHGAVVVVDVATGMVEIETYVVVHDCGVMINPTIVEGQILGGTAQGIGGAFYEKLRFDEDGQPLVTTFMDYLIPTAMEIPPIEIITWRAAAASTPWASKGWGRAARSRRPRPSPVPWKTRWSLSAPPSAPSPSTRPLSSR